jgi:hypothetical protein
MLARRQKLGAKPLPCVARRLPYLRIINRVADKSDFRKGPKIICPVFKRDRPRREFTRPPARWRRCDLANIGSKPLGVPRDVQTAGNPVSIERFSWPSALPFFCNFLGHFRFPNFAKIYAGHVRRSWRRRLQGINPPFPGGSTIPSTLGPRAQLGKAVGVPLVLGLCLGTITAEAEACASHRWRCRRHPHQ